MASLQTKHQKGCSLGRDWSKPSTPGCSCAPAYYVVIRQGRKSEKIHVGKNKRDAERALRKLAVSLDEGSYRPQLNTPFDSWADRWLGSLERKPTTIDSYRSTVAYAKATFGSKVVRTIGPSDVSRFNQHLRDDLQLAPSSRAKHLRVLGACLESASQHGYAARNPVRELPKAERPRPQRKEAAYFTDAEIPQFFQAIEPGVFRVLFELALKTGMRQGELLALQWGDLDLADGTIHVRRSITDGHVSLPKNHERRTIDVTTDVVEMLGSWWGESGRPTDDALILPGDTGYLVPSTILKRELYPTMQRAGIDRVGPTGEKRTFHSLRHTFARIALENGAELTWLARHLGHSSTAVTDRVYGHWSATSRKAQVERLAGAFGI